MEAGRPDSVTREKLEAIKQHKVDRISVNPQTMKDETLKIIGRHHTVDQTVEAYKLAREVGFDNINMDLIIGLPGETVTIENAKVYINGVELEEPYLKEQWINGTGPYEFQVPEGCYFVMGDNRNTSQDARYWRNTYVSKDKIIGKAGFIYYPFDRIGVVE